MWSVLGGLQQELSAESDNAGGHGEDERPTMGRKLRYENRVCRPQQLRSFVGVDDDDDDDDDDDVAPKIVKGLE